MPVVIQQPSPQAPDITAGAGAAQQFSRDLPTLAGLYEAQARNATAMATAGMQAGAHVASTRMSVGAQQDAAERQARERAREFDLSQQPSDRDQFMMYKQAELQQQQIQSHAQAAAWLQGQEMSQKEQMRYQQAKNTLGYLKEAHDNGVFTDDEYVQKRDELINNVLMPGDERQKNALAKQEEAKANLMMQQAAQMKAMENVHMQGAPRMENGMPIMDRATGEPAMFYTTKNGEIKQVPSPNPVLTEKDWHEAYDKVEKEVGLRLNEMDVQRKLGGGKPMTQEERDAEWQTRMNGLLGGRGMGATYEDYLRQKREAYQSRKAMGVMGGGMGAGGGDTSETSPLGGGGNVTAPAPQPTQWSPEQLSAVSERIASDPRLGGYTPEALLRRAELEKIANPNRGVGPDPALKRLERQVFPFGMPFEKARQ